jgi:hypothetical protein
MAIIHFSERTIEVGRGVRRVAKNRINQSSCSAPVGHGSSHAYSPPKATGGRSLWEDHSVEQTGADNTYIKDGLGNMITKQQ